MNFFNRISIRNRILGIFVIWLLIFAFFGGVVYTNINRLGDVSENFYDQSMRLSTAAIEARVDIIKIQRSVRELMLMEDEGEIQRVLDDIKILDGKVLNNLDIIKDSSQISDVEQLEGEIRGVFIKWQDSRDDLVNMVLDKNKKDAMRIIQIKNSEFVKKLEEKLDRLDIYGENSAKSLITRSRGIQDIQKKSIGVWLGGLILISIILFVIVIRSILDPIASLQGAMYSSVNTGELCEVNLKGKNEFVEMSGYYNQLVRKLKEYFWIKDGRSSLNEELAGNIPLSELTLKAVSFLARITDSGHGVFYIYNNEEKVLHLNASYAFTEKDQMSNKYALGEGLVGQAALERKPILLKNVKRQDALIVAGTIREAPLNIYTLPLVYEDELYGVIELSSFEPFTTLKQEFLKDASKIISVNLYSAIQSQRIRNLLKISESAQKEAKRKADELKEANEELEEQQRLLQQQTEELQQTNAQLEEQQQLLQQQSEELQQTNSQLEEQQQLLEEQSRLLNTKNQDLEISREELLKRSEELERVSKYKSEFLANMSHELRTPLNSIILLAKMLDRKMTNELSQKDREKINIIYKAGQELLRLINDILDLSKIESGKLSLNVTTFNSSELLEDLKQMFEGVSKEKNIRFVLEDDLDTKLKGDKDKISQILRNFLSNAFKFTEEGSVTLKVMPDEDREGGVVFSVIDTGIGISENKLSMIFEEFQQGDGSISRKYGGTGLGLSISRKLTDLMKGEVRLNSREGEGSTFSLYLPDLIYKQNDKADLIIKHSDADRQYSSEKSKKVIMVIEDDKDFAHYIENINSSAGFETLLAYSGREGLDMLKKHKVDGILLDLKLPDVSGVEVLRELKSTIELRKIPVHIISVCDEDNKLKKMGALGYKQKPVNEDEIKELVSRMIAFSEKSPKNLLVIEDDTIQQDAIRELIESREIKLKIVDAEEKARCELARGIYDAVVLDLELKDGNGINICRFIGEQNIQIPVIIYTGKDLSVDQEKEIRRYADSIIVKTANSEERLLDEVTLFLHKVKGNVDHGHYLFSKMKRECALSLDRKRILIVDDDPRNVFVLASALEDYGAEIIDADNGKSALEMLRKYKTDLILLDIMMPVMDGYETIRAIRNDKELRDIPIIALTAKSLKGDREKCIEAGANDYISKPVDYDVLTRLVKAWIVK